MTEELKIIKKLYGEAMAHFCRDIFPTILETEGKLLDVLKSNFAESHDLFVDLSESKLLDKFKKYIYNLFEIDDDIINIANKTPEELMKSVGYTLYQCKTEEDIQLFRKYYAMGEVLCTFNGGRLKRCYVFFAVKDNVGEIKRENFLKPERQDLYGTSVISIQFSRDSSHILSIKNRYNHHVSNPDATFGNDLEQIVFGLTDAFEHTYGLKQKYINDEFEIPGYVRANDGKWYKYNYEISDVYYCPDNIIIYNRTVIRYVKEKYIVMDYFILDLEKKELYLYDIDIDDSFLEVIGKINKIIILKSGKEKEVKIINDKDEEIVITIDKNNRIIGLKSNSIKQISDCFLHYNETLMTLNLPNLQQVGNAFLYCNKSLENLSLPSLVQVGDNFFSYGILKNLDLPNLQQTGYGFLYYNDSLTCLDLPKLQKVGGYFLFYNEIMDEVKLPSLQYIKRYFLFHNKSLKSLKLPLLEKVENDFLRHNESLVEIDLSSVKQIGDYFLYNNKSLVSLNLPLLQYVGRCFLYNNEILEFVNLPLLREVGYGFLYSNKKLEAEKFAFLRKLYMFWFKKNMEDSKINLPNLKKTDGGFIYNNWPVRRALLRRIKH